MGRTCVCAQVYVWSTRFPITRPTLEPCSQVPAWVSLESVTPHTPFAPAPLASRRDSTRSHLVRNGVLLGLPGDASGKESASKAGDLGSIPGLGRPPGGGHSNLLQLSCLENPVDRGAWRATVRRVTQSWTQLKRLSTHTRNPFNESFLLTCEKPRKC